MGLFSGVSKIFGGGSSGGGSSTTVQKADPWEGVQPYLRSGYEELSRLVKPQNMPQYFPGQTIATPSNLEAFGQRLQTDQGGNIFQLGQQGMGAVGDLFGAGNYAQLGGDFGLQSLLNMQNQAGALAGTGATGTRNAASLMGILGNNANVFGNQNLAAASSGLGAFGTQAGAQGSSAINNALYGMGGLASQMGGLGGSAAGGALGALAQGGAGAGVTGNTMLGNSNAALEAIRAAAMQQSGIGLSRGQEQLEQTSGLSNLFAPSALANAGQNLQAQARLGGLGALAGTGGAQRGMNQLLAAGDVMNNPYLEAAMGAATRPLVENFQEQVMPGIRQGAMSAGQMGGSRQGIAEGIAARGLANAMGDITARMGSEAYGQGLNAVQAGAGIGQGLAQQGLAAAGQQAQFGQGLAGLGLQAGQSQANLGAGLLGQGAGIEGQQLGIGADLIGQGLSAQQARGQLGANLLGQAGGLQGQMLGAGIDLSGQNLAALQARGQLGSQAADRAASLQGQLADLGLSQQQLAMSGQSQAGQLGQGFFGEGLTGIGRGLALLPGAQSGLTQAGSMIENVGRTQTADRQALIDAEMARWNYNQQLPFNMMSDYMSILQGAPGGTTTQNQQQAGGGNRLMSGLGGAMTGASIGSAFPVIGTGIGAIAGGLLGLFS